MQYVGEMIGLTLSGYGLWFAVRGIKMYLSTDKAWWRPINRQNRYPYPVAVAHNQMLNAQMMGMRNMPNYGEPR